MGEPVLFNSYQFLFAFLPLVLLGWWVVMRGKNLRLAYLALASYAFYAAFAFPTGLMLLPLLWASTSIDYFAGKRIYASDDPVMRKRLLSWALFANLGFLAIFKYLGFFAGTFNAVIGLFGAPGLMPVVHLLLPIGISFYTFNSMSYTIDIYRGRVKPARSIIEYSAFVAMFPHLIAGPIVRYSDIESQLKSLKTKLTSRMIAVGVFFFVCGLFKKIVIADNLVPTVDRLFAHSDQLTIISGWAAALGYAMQLYFDFSAYSDMAVGLAILLGFRFPQNFNSPYKAVNIADFWRRWHMTLSSWLRDYVFVPLGGSRAGKIMTGRNLLITMFLGGLWHGAAWVFILWGLGHGVLLAGHAILKRTGFVMHSEWMARTITFLCVVVLWVPFRAGAVSHTLGAGSISTVAENSMSIAGNVLSAMFGSHGLGLSDLSLAASSAGAQVSFAFVFFVAGLIAFVQQAPNTWEIKFVPSRRTSLTLAAMCGWSILLLAAPSPFLYFQF